MKNKIINLFKKVPIRMYCQLTAHLIYVLFSFWFFGVQNRFPIWLLTILFSTILYFIILLQDNSWKFKGLWFPLTGMVIGCSTFLNLDGESALPYCMAVAIGLLGRKFFQRNGVHFFNPSALGIFVVIMLFPKLGSLSFTWWVSNNFFICTIIILGLIVTNVAKRFWLSLAYQVGFITFSLITVFCLRNFFGLIHYSYLLWPAGLLGISPLIFTYHLISDPSTSPSSIRHQLFFGASISLLQIIFIISGFIANDFIAYLLVQAMYSIYKNNPFNFKMINPV